MLVCDSLVSRKEGTAGRGGQMQYVGKSGGRWDRGQVRVGTDHHLLLFIMGHAAARLVG